MATLEEPLVQHSQDDDAHTDTSLKLLQTVTDGNVKLDLYGTPDYPMIEATLAPHAVILAEPGRMIMLPEDVKFSTTMGDGSDAGMLNAMKKGASRMMSGENLMLAKFENETDSALVMRFGTVIPGMVTVINLKDLGGEIIAASGSYLMGSSGLKVEMCFKQSIGAAFLGGAGFILQRIAGQGICLLQGGGTVMKETLTPERPRLRVESGCLVAFTSNMDYTVAPAGGLKSMLFGGEGIAFCDIQLKPGQKGGYVWVESFPWSKWISRIKSHYSH